MTKPLAIIPQAGPPPAGSFSGGPPVHFRLGRPAFPAGFGGGGRAVRASLPVASLLHAVSGFRPCRTARSPVFGSGKPSLALASRSRSAWASRTGFIVRAGRFPGGPAADDMLQVAGATKNATVPASPARVNRAAGHSLPANEARLHERRHRYIVERVGPP